MKQEENLIVRIDDLITICYILPDYEKFNNNLQKFINQKYSRDLAHELWKKSNNQFSFSSGVINTRKVQKFYNENKNVIDTINKYSDINSFINYNYDFVGKQIEQHNLDFFYKYILNNKDNIEQILLLLEKIKKLGFTKLQFNQNLDFSNDEYYLYTYLGHNFKVEYFDNIKLIPNYRNDVVKYKTESSNYKIVARINVGEISKFDNEIIVNSLLFDANRLPCKINIETVFNSIIKLKKQHDAQMKVMHESIDLSVCIGDLTKQIEYTSHIINSLNNIPNKNKLMEILKNVENGVLELQKLSAEYDRTITSNNGESIITQDILEKEKRLYLERRYWNSIDID